MTPVIVGRWQTRTYLTLWFGIPVTLFFALVYHDMRNPFLLLLYVLMMGLLLDVGYNQMQRHRWENDWPPVLHLISGIVEGGLLWVAVRWIGLPGVNTDLAFWRFIAHYGTTWFVMFCVLWGPMKVMFPLWRFRGGRVWQ